MKLALVGRALYFNCPSFKGFCFFGLPLFQGLLIFELPLFQGPVPFELPLFQGLCAFLGGPSSKGLVVPQQLLPLNCFLFPKMP